MRTHFHAEIEDLERAVTSLANMVRENIDVAVQGLAGHDQSKAQDAIRADHEVDLQEVRNEEACLKIIALHQPVADDLRYLIVLNKANHDLERISDLAAKIAESILTSDETEASKEWTGQMAGITLEVGDRLSRMIKALLEKDEKTAMDTWFADADINERCDELSKAVREAIISSPEKSKVLFPFLTAIGHLERMGDHVKSIARHIVYLVSGKIVRHRAKEFKNLAAVEQ